jgi:exodeoxyribonuclease III
MKIATFNVNNINKRLANLLAWLDQAQPDVVCLQELKCSQRDLPIAALEKAGYGAVWRGQRTWNGVAILARDATPVLTRDELPGDPSDTQSRYIEAAVNGVLIACLYAPNGNPQPGPKFDYKLAWHKRLNSHAKSLIETGIPVVLAGDFNIAPTPADVYSTKSYDDNALVQPQSRKAFAELLKQGWTDSVRKAFPDQTVYTFWDYRRNRWERNAGLRLDHVLLGEVLSSQLAEVGIDRDVRGCDEASDHAPVWIRVATTT